MEILKEDEVIKGLVKVFEKQKLIINKPLAESKKDEKKEVLGFVISGDIEETTSPFY